MFLLFPRFFFYPSIPYPVMFGRIFSDIPSNVFVSVLSAIFSINMSLQVSQVCHKYSTFCLHANMFAVENHVFNAAASVLLFATWFLTFFMKFFSLVISMPRQLKVLICSFLLLIVCFVGDFWVLSASLVLFSYLHISYFCDLKEGDIVRSSLFFAYFIFPYFI